MEINVNVKIDLSGNTLQMLGLLLGGANFSKEQAPAPKEVDIKIEKKKPGKTAEATPAVAETKQTAEGGGESVNEDELRQQIRAKVVALRDAGHREKTVSIMAAYGIDKLSALPVEKLTDFINELNQVK